MKNARLIILALVVLAAPAWGGDIVLRIGRQAVSAEVADTLAAQERGLMHRDHLCGNCGMLFVFAGPGRYGFWMKNTPLPLSIAFIGRDGRIINIAEMRPNTLEVHYPQRDAVYVLEMQRGWFDAHGIKPGDGVVGLPAQGRSAHGNTK
ncbi:MAG TPA: DUF192 domain-containing protein [Gallionellaceae bacterium]|nr:DUF192 domain-containing protein [Gallionellaceae bacterium]